MLTLRKSEDRGQGNYNWLKAKYSFSFAGYYDSNFLGLSDLIVINEDRIAPAKGFAEHPHNDMEIITYVIDGAIAHQDSMGHEGIVRPGEIQYMSAGAGVRHSEYNALDDAETHLLQIWITPDREGVAPNYGQTSYLDRLKENQLCLLVSSDGRDGSIKIHQDASAYTARLKDGHSLGYTFAKGRSGWIQLVSGQLKVNGVEINSGDGLSITAEELIEISSSADSEFLLFDLR